MSISDSVTAVGLSKVIICPYLIQWISIRWSYVLIRFSDFGESYRTSTVRLKGGPNVLIRFSESYHTSTVRVKGGPMSVSDSVTSVGLI